MAQHSYNLYTVGRTLWKTLAVQALTYAADDPPRAAHTVKCLDRHQQELGRWLLGCNWATASAAMIGKIGWSTFHAREARSEIEAQIRVQRKLQQQNVQIPAISRPQNPAIKAG